MFARDNARARIAGNVAGFASEVGKFEEPRGDFSAPPGATHPVFENRGDGAAIKRAEMFIIGKLPQAAAVVADHFLAPVHLLVEFDANFENLLEVVLVIVEELIHFAVADENDLHVNVDGLRFQCSGAEREEKVYRLDFELPVIKRSLESAPHSGFRERIERVHHEEPSVRAQQRPATKIHEIGIPAAARIVAAVNRAEQIRVRGDGFKNNGALIMLVMSENYVYTIDAERIAILALGPRRSGAVRRGLLLFAFALLERLEVVKNVMTDFLEIFRYLLIGIFFLQFLDHAVHQDGRCLLLEVTHLAG